MAEEAVLFAARSGQMRELERLLDAQPVLVSARCDPSHNHVSPPKSQSPPRLNRGTLLSNHIPRRPLRLEAPAKGCLSC